MKTVPQKYKDFVKDCAQKAAWLIGVSHYEIDIHYMSEKSEDDCCTRTKRGMMTTDRRYLRGTLRLYPCVLKDWESGNKKEVKDVVFHEISHLVTQHLYDVGVATYRDDGEMRDAWETLTEVVSRLALRIDDNENNNGKKK